MLMLEPEIEAGVDAAVNAATRVRTSLKEVEAIERASKCDQTVAARYPRTSRLNENGTK